MRTPDPCPTLDELTFAVGMGAAFPGRPAVLGQPQGRHVFERSETSVVCTLVGDPADAFGHLAQRLEVPRTLREARTLFVGAVTHQLPMPPGLCLEFVVRLAADRLEVSRAVTTRRSDAIAARAAAEELVVVAYEVLSFGSLAPRPAGAPPRRRLFER